MASPIQEQQDNHLHRDGQSHPLPLWVRWLIVLFVLFVVIGGSVLWIIQGVRAIIPIAVLTALGILIAFSQVLPWLFPSIRHGHSVTSSKQTLPPDITEISQNLPLKTISQREPDAKDITISKPKIDWGQAPQLENFYGREQELTELEHWIVDDRCQVVAVLGMGGMGKTSLATTLAERLEDECEYVFWRDLKNAPPLENILKTCIQFFSNHERIDLPEDIDDQIALLVQYLRDHRCLLVLDNLETVLQAGNRAGQYQVGHESYGQLIRRVGETRHQSCLLLTSREKPGEVALFRRGGLISPFLSTCRVAGH